MVYHVIWCSVTLGFSIFKSGKISALFLISFLARPIFTASAAVSVNNFPSSFNAGIDIAGSTKASQP
ncbi:Uncharacterised protein [Sphingobacterium daejeonense]|nr:Uncharacterised protein [Sphingobacterium daejeonense]